MLNSFVNEYIQNYKSTFSNLFYFMTKSKITCQNCKIITYNFGVAFFIIFPLEKIRQFKSYFYGPDINFVNIYDHYYLFVSQDLDENELIINKIKHLKYDMNNLIKLSYNDLINIKEMDNIIIFNNQYYN